MSHKFLEKQNKAIEVWNCDQSDSETQPHDGQSFKFKSGIAQLSDSLSIENIKHTYRRRISSSSNPLKNDTTQCYDDASTHHSSVQGDAISERNAKGRFSKNNTSIRSDSVESGRSCLSLESVEDTSIRQPSSVDSHQQGVNGLTQLLESIAQTVSGHNKQFAPSTPHVHKFRTEMCRNYELYGSCHFGDKCSFAHGKTQMMLKTNLPANFKTKQCKNFQVHGHCSYGLRCQFLHGETKEERQEGDKPANVKTNYREIFVHNMNVSIQEHQKKKTILKERRTPSLEYLNINSRKTKRLSCFSDIIENEDEGIKQYSPLRLSSAIFVPTGI